MSFFSRLFPFLRRPADPQPQPQPQWLVLGLGNPGRQYAATRHNVGYLATDLLLEKGLIQERGLPAATEHVHWAGIPVLLARSTTYMNTSGEAISALCDKYGISSDHVVVLHDELDLPLGEVRVKLGGNENGHNGLKSTTQLLGTRDYLRVRIGIGRPANGMTVIDHVLGEYDAPQEQLERAAHAAQLLVTEGLAQAQQVIHSKKK